MTRDEVEDNPDERRRRPWSSGLLTGSVLLGVQLCVVPRSGVLTDALARLNLPAFNSSKTLFAVLSVAFYFGLVRDRERAGPFFLAPGPFCIAAAAVMWLTYDTPGSAR